MSSFIAAGMLLLAGSLSPSVPAPKTVVVLGVGPVAASSGPAQAPISLHDRRERLADAGNVLRTEGGVTYAFSPKLWPERAMSVALASVKMLAGRLQPTGLLSLSDQGDFRSRLSSFLERTSGVVITNDSALALESSQHFAITNGDRTIQLVMSAHHLPQQTRERLQQRPLRPSTKSIEERMAMPDQGSPLTVVVPMLRSVTLEVFGEGWDQPSRRLELFGNAASLMAQEVAQFRSQFVSAYEDLTQTMATNGLAPPTTLPGPARFASIPADVQALLRNSARAGYLSLGFDSPEAAEAFVEGATLVNAQLRFVVIGSELGSDGRPGATVGVAISRP